MDYKMVLLLLINGAIYNKKLGLMDEIWFEIDWMYVKEEANQHNCMAIVYPVVKRIQERFNCIEPEVYAMWEEDVEKLCDEHKAMDENAQVIIDELHKENVEVALFKGGTLAELYPNYLYRDSYDVDLYIGQEDKEKAIDILEKLGYVVDGEEDLEDSKMMKKGDFIIDLHFSLWEGYEEYNLEYLKSLNIDDKASFIDFEKNNIKCKTFDVTKQYEYLFCHMVKHFKKNGIGIRHLIDVTLYYNKYENVIDAKLLREDMKKLDYLEFYEAITSLCITHLGMKKSALITDYIIEPHVYDKLLNDIFDSGTYGGKTLRRIRLVQMKEKMNIKSFAYKLKKKIMKNNSNSVSGVTEIEKKREELKTLLGLNREKVEV